MLPHPLWKRIINYLLSISSYGSIQTLQWPRCVIFDITALPAKFEAYNPQISWQVLLWLTFLRMVHVRNLNSKMLVSVAPNAFGELLVDFAVLKRVASTSTEIPRFHNSRYSKFRDRSSPRQVFVGGLAFFPPVNRRDDRFPCMIYPELHLMESAPRPQTAFCCSPLRRETSAGVF